MELLNRGRLAVGVDSGADAIARARKLGAPVVYASWPTFTSAPVDAVVFTGRFTT